MRHVPRTIIHKSKHVCSVQQLFSKLCTKSLQQVPTVHKIKQERKKGLTLQDKLTLFDDESMLG
jgi:hypothetical protein